MHDQTGRLVAYVVGGAVFLVFLALRMRRAMASRPFRLQYIWVLPTLFLALTVFTLAAHPPEGMQWLWLALALAAGFGLGWVSGATIHLEVDPTTRAVRAKASPLAMVFIVALVLVRALMRTLAGQLEAAYHLPALLIQDAFLLLALGLFLARALEMGLRARRLSRAAVEAVFA
ncbi:CcdC protein domain-containing protein [Caulobacter sp. S45]|uniref:CcdC protein domain-containing protein n=1 Tax=Caulobacter sp. S45 TaxID=1641861 RepID=UPI001576BB40|nr:CcdC protein domain-containing protein [Caulobacter sp. S45]